MSQGYLTIPKILNTDPRYARLTSDAKLLYAALKDRLNLSKKNGKAWKDKAGRTFVYFTRKAMCDLLKRSEPYVRKVMRMLVECGLVEERRQGLTHPNIIYPILIEGEECSGENRDSAPDRNDSSRSNPNPSKPDKNKPEPRGKGGQNPPENGYWIENGQKLCHQGATKSARYVGRYYAPGELNALFEEI